MLNNKAYDRKKVSLKKDLESCLFSHSKFFSTATPEDIRLFLVNRDAKGKTKVHDVCCSFLGEKRSKECSCPSRLAFGTVTCLVQHAQRVLARNHHGRCFFAVICHKITVKCR